MKTMKIFITGSTTGLGLIAGHMLQKQGHEVVLHARNKNSKLIEGVPYIFGDLSKLEEMKFLAEQANALGRFDAVIHNAGVYTAGPEDLFTVNVLAPYVLTCLMERPSRLIYLSSGMHLSGVVNMDPKSCSYSDTKLLVLMLTKYFARLYPETFSNAVDPGWVPTRMGGEGAPDDLTKGAETQAWLAVSDELKAKVTGQYFHHKEIRKSNPLADSPEAQEKLVKHLEQISKVKIP